MPFTTSRNADEAEMKMIKQIGIRLCPDVRKSNPWKETDLRATMDRFSAAGLTVINMMIGGMQENRSMVGKVVTMRLAKYRNLFVLHVQQGSLLLNTISMQPPW